MTTPMHPQRHSFLAAITAAPHDVALRLIFADWLAENDEEAFAALVRIGMWPFAQLEQKRGKIVKCPRCDTFTQWTVGSGAPSLCSACEREFQERILKEAGVGG